MRRMEWPHVYIRIRTRERDRHLISVITLFCNAVEITDRKWASIRQIDSEMKEHVLNFSPSVQSVLYFQNISLSLSLSFQNVILSL